MKRMHENEYTSLRERLGYLKRIRRVEIADALRFAVELGDLRENAEYDAAVDDYQRVEREIYLLEKEIENASIVDYSNSDTVEIGSTIVLDFDGEEEIYTLTNSSNFDLNSVSLSSALGNAIVHHKVGDKVFINSPGGNYFVTIKEVR